MIKKLVLFLILFSVCVSGSDYCFDAEDRSVIEDYLGLEGMEGKLCIQNMEELISGGDGVKVIGDCKYESIVLEEVAGLGFEGDYSVVCEDVSEWVEFSEDLGEPYSGGKMNFNWLTLIIGVVFVVLVIIFGPRARKNKKPLFGLK